VQKLGRPTRFTKAIADKICERLANGETLRAICRDEGMPRESTVRAWALNDLNGFYAQYTRARDLGLDALSDETLELADIVREGVKVKQYSCPRCQGTGEEKSGECPKCGGSGGLKEVVSGDMVERARLQVETRKWYLSKLAPKRYGERPDSDTRDDRLDEILDIARAGPPKKKK